MDIRNAASENGVFLSSGVRERVENALLILMQSRCYAEDLGYSQRDFAVELAQLRAAGLTTNDLKWLVGKGLVVHAREADTCEGTGAVRGGLTFTEESRFRITDEGAALIGHHETPGPVSGDASRPQPTQLGSESRPTSPTSSKRLTVVPRWDSDRRELWFDGRLVKRFMVPSRDQESVLAAFEIAGWPQSIADPLPARFGADPKRSLEQTVRRLNRQQRLVRFKVDVAARGVRWMS